MWDLHTIPKTMLLSRCLAVYVSTVGMSVLRLGCIEKTSISGVGDEKDDRPKQSSRRSAGSSDRVSSESTANSEGDGVYRKP